MLSCDEQSRKQLPSVEGWTETTNYAMSESDARALAAELSDHLLRLSVLTKTLLALPVATS